MVFGGRFAHASACGCRRFVRKNPAKPRELKPGFVRIKRVLLAALLLICDSCGEAQFYFPTATPGGRTLPAACGQKLTAVWFWTVL
jgi:hypothetical protein